MRKRGLTALRYQALRAGAARLRVAENTGAESSGGPSGEPQHAAEPLTVEEFVARHGRPYSAETDLYERPPFAADTKAGKNTAIYNAHAYHTKVPPQGIIPYIEHYTDPGDVVLDPFCGSGMTGVAALTCPSGPRRVILNDLSPAACHIASNYCTPVDLLALQAEWERIKKAVKDEFAWLYGTQCRTCGSPATIQYTIWSDVFQCAKCQGEIVLWRAAIDHSSGKVLESFLCPSCNARWKKSQVLRISSVPVITNYRCNAMCGRGEQAITDDELDRISTISERKIPYWYPDAELPHGRQTRKLKQGAAGVNRIDQMFTHRNLWALARIWKEIQSCDCAEVRRHLQFVFTAALPRSSRQYKYSWDRKGGLVSGTLYIPSLNCELSPIEIMERKLTAVIEAQEVLGPVAADIRIVVNCGSATSIPIVPESVDYVFTDPPYGESLQYAELNFFWEAWLQQYSRIEDDCVMNYVHKKDLEFYRHRMCSAFTEMHRILKPNRWASVVFHNTDDRIWAAIQQAAQAADFEVVSAVAFDKKQGTFNQVNMGKDNAAGFDVVLNLHKRPRSNGRARTENDLDSLLVDAILTHLRTGPASALRTSQFLHSLSIRTLLNANVQIKEVSIPYLEALLPVNGFKRVDGRWYLRGERVRGGRLGIAIEDEASAIEWLRRELEQGPKNRGELDPYWKMATLNVRLEKDLDEILEENFWMDEASSKWRIPTEVEQARMEIAARDAADRALRSLLSRLEEGRPLASLPNSAALAKWVRYCAEHDRWRDVRLLFPLLNRSDFSGEGWFELENYHRHAVQQTKGDEQSGPRRAGKRRKSDNLELDLDLG